MKFRIFNKYMKPKIKSLRRSKLRRENNASTSARQQWWLRIQPTKITHNPFGYIRLLDEEVPVNYNQTNQPLIRSVLLSSSLSL